MLLQPALAALADDPVPIDTGNNAWMLASSALVLLMTPGLAFFYGGMVRRKTVINMLMMSFTAMGTVGLVYVLWGYSMSFSSDNLAGGLFANPFTNFGLKGLFDPGDGTASNSFLAAAGVPALTFVAFQLTFAIITVALISGSVADRMKYSTWVVFSIVWVTLVYFPLAHMVWGGGFLSNADGGLSSMIFGNGADGAALVAPKDFAGGTVVHIDAGIAGIMLALMLGKRRGYGRDPMRPHSVPFVMLGAGLLWFGWFGFNAGSEGAADGIAGLAWINTSTATSCALLGWLIVEKMLHKKATGLGAASGAVAGLVAITPACAFVSPVGSIFIGLIAGALCAWAIGLKNRFGLDDALDVGGVHLVGGITGTVLIGFFSISNAELSWGEGDDPSGIFYGGDAKQLIVQVVVALFALVFSGVLTLVIALVLKSTMGLRVSPEVEDDGDTAMHGESAYDFEGSTGIGTSGILSGAGAKEMAEEEARA